VTGPDVHRGSRVGRRTELRRRRRQRRLRLVAAVLALALVATVAVVVLLVRRAPEVPTAVEPQGRTQSTLLFQVQGGDGNAVASALLAHDPGAGSGAAVLVPPQVIVEVPGAGSLPFGQAVATASPERSRDALADLLGVTVDAGWVLDAATFSALVDELGGLRIGVDVPVVQDGAVLLRPGEQQLNGEQVTAFLRYLAPGEQEQARLARVQDVLDALLTALPDSPEQVTALVSALGPGSRSSLPAPELAAFLVAAAETGEAGELQYETLPVIPIDAGGGVTAFRVDAPAARNLVDRLLAQSVPMGERETGNRVLVLNGVGTPGLGEAVRKRLVEEGFVFVGSRNAPRFGYPNTVVLVPEATPEAQLLGERVAAALGVPADVRSDELGSVADVVVIVGADFVP
jgi:anionic cell wall polymer biosynthesis LytR-Cps2A-Psr (LCP) family protein